MRAYKTFANGISHHVREWGDPAGAPVLLLHGFPDSGAVWSSLAPLLAAQGYRAIAPDMRGFGDTDAPARVADYAIDAAIMPDILALVDALSPGRPHLVGHDWGAAAGWMLAGRAAGRFQSWTALGVGHPLAFLAAGAEQRRRSAYIALHLARGLCERVYRRDDWAFLRRHWEGVRDVDETIALLARPGRLSAGLAWYRANIPLSVIAGLAKPHNAPAARLPTLAAWPSGDRYLVEARVTGSAAYVEAPFRYERIDGAGHWAQVDAPEAVAALLVSHFRAHSPA